MVNTGNFGVVEVSQRGSHEVKSKCKVVDFLPPNSASFEPDRYTYGKLYRRYGFGITESFASHAGNTSHTYEPESAVSKILCDSRTEALWGLAIDSIWRFKSGKKPGIGQAIDECFGEITGFLEHNAETLRLNDVDGRFKDLTTRRFQDLAAYRDRTLRNFR